MRDTGMTNKRQDGDVVLGDDWVAPQQTVADEMQEKRARRGLFTLRGSPLTRKIIIFNLIALIIMVTGILHLNSTRQSLVRQSAGALVTQATLIADVFEAQLPAEGDVSFGAGEGINVEATLQGLSLRGGVEVFVYDTTLSPVATIKGVRRGDALNLFNEAADNSNLISDALASVWALFGNKSTPSGTDVGVTPEELRAIVKGAFDGGTEVGEVFDQAGGTVFSAATPVLLNGAPVAVVSVTSPSGEIDNLVRADRERVLQMFIVALLVSVGLSLVLASTIANPLADLAEAAELGRDKNASNVKPGRIRIPDLSARPDEIGRLSRALRGMVKALYNRIDSNEQFA
ncbi:MAG: sensor N-terminal transmembrane domain-containing protein, partial [Rhodobacteraceae bacterium]|nr:sensor N-terminal transmembrane domain-containing protein [Paracoccaceae bacterium]